MKRRSGIIIFMCLCCMLLFGMTVKAEQSDFQYQDVTNGVQITAYKGSDKNVIIPEQIEGKNVVSIGESAFYNKDITGIQIPATVKAISKRSFYYCRHLSSVTFTGDGLESIGEEAFADCYALTNFTFPVSVRTLDDGAFKSCGFQGKVDLSGYILVMGKQCFSGCKNVTEFVLPQGMSGIPDYGFAMCSSLQTVTIISNTINSIGEYAFTGCNSLQTINLPESLVSIGAYAFYGCGSLTSITIPKAVNSIGENAFYSCGLKTVNCAYGAYAYYFFKGEYRNLQVVGYGAYLDQEVVNIMVGEKLKLKMVNDNGNTSFRSSNPKVASVTSAGVVKGIKSGKAVITAVNGDVTSSCVVIVKQIELNLKKAKLTEGFALNLSLNCTGKIKWSSSNKKIATVSSKGKVLAKKPGKVTITAKLNNKKYTCKITVYKNEMKYNSLYSDTLLTGTNMRTVRIAKEKNYYVTDMIIYNNTDYDIIRMDSMDYTIYVCGRTFLVKHIRNMPLNVPAHGQQKFRIVYKGGEIKYKKKVDLRNTLLTHTMSNGKVTHIVYY